MTQAETFRKYALRKSNILTLAFYVFSAWLYSEIYIWSRAPEDKLGFTELGREYERIKLNERPLYLRYLFVILAVAQSIVHVSNDYDKIDVAALKPKKERDDSTAAASIRRGLRPREVLTKQFVGMVRGSASLMATSLLLASVLYFLGLRTLIWEYYYSFSRNLWSLSKTSRPTGLAPFLPLISRFLAQGTLLVLLWKFVNTAFDLYIAQEPLKNDKPITDDSKDPNGTLLNGLKSKKDAVKVCDAGLCMFYFSANSSRLSHFGNLLLSPTLFLTAAKPSTVRSTARKGRPFNKLLPSVSLKSNS